MTLSPSQFGYPRALYDPNYVPPKLLHRTKELKSLLNIFQSSLNPGDLFDINVYIHGIRGIGKTVFAKYFIELLKANFEEKFIPIHLNLTIKNPNENLRLIVELYSQSISNKFTYLKNSKELWSYFHFLRNKSNIPLILIFDNVDYFNQPLYERFIRYSKDLKISTIATSQISPRSWKNKSDVLTEYLDFPLKLDIYSPSALLDILSQRISIAFPVELDHEILQYIVDIVTQFDNYRPSTCITVLKTIYHQLISGNDINPTLIRESSYPLLEFPYQGDLDCLLQLDDSLIELLYYPFLEKIALYFKNGKNIYVSYKELFRIYRIACDELLLPYNQNQFEKFIEKLVFDGFLYPSQFNANTNENRFFIIIDPFRLLEYLEIKFSEDLD
ncbi:MAG TPA: hypothetical protein VMV49_09225 [Candidatus Deferrimicrobium sp.]|nr:hypothetical protein [Candidatus Deferrimicrobium sp.]